MKRLILIAIILALMISNSFAADEWYLHDTKKWASFYTDDKSTFSYEYKGSYPGMVATYKFDDAIGYLYFYVKIEPASQKVRDEGEKILKEDEALKNHKFGYVMGVYRLECKSETVELQQVMLYSDTKKFISAEKMKNKNAEKLAGSKFEKMPFYAPDVKYAKGEAEVRDRYLALQKKYGIEKIETIDKLEANPYEYEGHVVAVVVQFQRMLSKSSAVFSSGIVNYNEFTDIPDQIIISGLPKGMHFKTGPYSRKMVVVKGKGATTATNAYGAKILVPHYQYIATVSGE